MKGYFLVVIFAIVCSWQAWCESSENVIRIPLEVHTMEGEVNIKVFEYAISEERIEFAVANFCENYQIKKSFCRTLYRIAKDMQRSKQAEIKNSISVNKDTLHSVETNFTEGLLKYPSIINAELNMYSNMLNGQISPDSTLEMDILNRIVSSLGLFSMSKMKPERIVLIHSLTMIPSFDGVSEWSVDKDNILLTILKRIFNAPDLIDSVFRIFVLNYGYTVPLRIQQAFSSVEFIQVSSDVALLEVPSVRVLQLLSSELIENSLDKTQLLYLSTLGAEYVKPYQSIADWRDMLLHFMVDEHKSAYHLLASGEFDAVTVNHHENQHVYWATARHLSKLPLLSLNESSMISTRKWLSLRSQSRFFIAHSSAVNHLHQHYPPYCYRRALLEIRSSDELSRDEFKRVCQYDQPEVKLTSACKDGDSDSECYYSSAGVGSRRSYAKCLGLEVNCK